MSRSIPIYQYVGSNGYCQSHLESIRDHDQNAKPRTNGCVNFNNADHEESVILKAPKISQHTHRCITWKRKGQMPSFLSNSPSPLHFLRPLPRRPGPSMFDHSGGQWWLQLDPDYNFPRTRSNLGFPCDSNGVLLWVKKRSYFYMTALLERKHVSNHRLDIAEQKGG